MEMTALRGLYTERMSSMPARIAWEQAVEHGAMDAVWAALDEAEATIIQLHDDIARNGRAARHLQATFGLRN